MSEKDNESESFNKNDVQLEEQKKPLKSSENPHRNLPDDPNNLHGFEILETGERIDSPDNIERTKKDNAKLVNEFEKMISEDEKLREFAEQNQKKKELAGTADNFGSDGKINSDDAEDKDLESIIDMRILDMLRLLEEYRRKCIEVDDDYIEAKRAEDKFEKTLAKATKKQKEQIRTFQEKELQSIELTQQQQYREFSEAWDEYMADYEATAYLSLEKLKERQMKEYQEFQDKCRDEIKKKMKLSRELLELRHVEEKLIKLK